MIRMKYAEIARIACSVAIATSSITFFHMQRGSDEPTQRVAKGFVSKPETAISIAEAVIKGLDSRFDQTKEKLKAVKRDGYWWIHTEGPGDGPGGSIEMEIEIHSGAILRYWISK